MTLRQIADQYVALLAAQYRGAPKARGTIGIYVKQALGDMLPAQIRDAFNVDTAVGAQLDIIGKYVGVPRNIAPPVDRPYYGFVNYDSGAAQNPNGFTDYLDPLVNDQAIWYQYQFYGTQNTDLTDAAYRVILNLKIILNSNSGTLASIMQLLKDLFGDTVTVVDNADMSLTYNVGVSPTIPRSAIKAYLPKPMGVRLIFPALTATVSPPSEYKLETNASPILVVTDSTFLAVAAGGDPSYTYLWEFYSGDNGVVPTTPTAAGTTFQKMLNPGDVTFASYRCKVTDSLGAFAFTSPIYVWLGLEP